MLVIPDEFKNDIDKAIIILKQIGITEIYLFGSITSNNYNNNSDIDLAVKGIPDDKYFYAIGKLDMELEHKFDLINLDKESYFNNIIKKNPGLIKIA